MADKKLSPKRFSAFMGIAALLGIIAIGGYMWIGAKSKTALSSRVASPPHANAVAGGPGTPEYDKLVQRQNDKEAAQAVQSGTTFMPSAVAPAVTPNAAEQMLNLPIPNPSPSANTAVAAPALADASGQNIPAPVQNVSDPQMTVGQPGNSPVMAEIQLLNAQWIPQTPAVTLATEPKKTFTHATTATKTHATVARKSADLTDLPRRGAILYGVMDTALNSRQPGPAMATVVSGRFQGARLLGGFSDEHDRLVVKFTTLVPYKKGKAGSIMAYAIDPKTTEAAVATSVNHHYFARWGGLLAANFLAGYGQAVANSGATSVTGTGVGGVAVTTHSTYTTQQELIQAAGQTGQAVANVLQQNFNEPATVRVAAGTPVGVLIINTGG